MRFTAGFMIGVVCLVFSCAASAGTISCPSTASPQQRIVALTTIGADAQCALVSGNNLTGNPKNDPFLLAHPNFVTIDKSDDAGSGLNSDAFGAAVVQGLNGGLLGSFDFSSVAGNYSQYALGFKTGGNGKKDNVSFVFLLPPSVASGMWEILQAKQALSHTVLYGVTAPVPLPPAVWLFLTAVGGLFGIRTARRT